jgi:hypothetical protein
LPEIARRYNEYEGFLKDMKEIQESPIYLQEKKNHIGYLQRTASLSTPRFTCDTHLIVAVNKHSQTHFGFKVRCSHFSDIPCFRFDADGITHNNIRDDVPLKARQITTPHFHRYEPDGVMIAYKTSVLLNPKEALAIQQDINFAMAHFCHEANIRDVNNKSPMVSREQGEFSYPDADPLNGVTFNHGN